MKKIEVKPNGHRRVYTEFTQPSLVQQQFKDECDVNKIIRKYNRGMPITHINRAMGRYMDLSSAPDYVDALNQVIQAQDAFQTLPSDLRKRFGNDPAQLLSFLGDSKNYDEAVKLGLVNPRQDAVGGGVQDAPKE